MIRVAFILLLATAAYAQPVLYFPLDDGPNVHLDASGNHPIWCHGGTCVMFTDPGNGPLTPESGVPGVRGSAVYCDGQSGAEIDNAPNLPSMTVVVWARPTGVDGTVIKRWSACGAPYCGPASEVLGIDASGYWFQRTISDNHLYEGTNITGPRAVLGKWTCLAEVVDDTATTRQLYVDGVLDATGGYSPPHAVYDYWSVCSPAGKLTGNGKVSGWFTGDVDELRIYDTALSDSDIQALCSLRAPTTPTAGMPASVPTSTMPPIRFTGKWYEGDQQGDFDVTIPR